MIDIEQITRVSALSKELLAERKRYERIHERWNSELTPKQAQKLNADLNWQAMAIIKLEVQLHVACVDAGLADLREPEHYQVREFNPSSFHRYNWTPPQPAALT